MMKEEWRGLGDAQSLDKLKALSKPLGRWHKQHFGNIVKKIKRFKDEIKKVDDMVSNGLYDGTVEAKRKALVRCCEVWYTRQDIHWKQMSRCRHAKEIDRNTRYFHNIASARRRNNRIESLVINGGLSEKAQVLEVLPSEEEIKDAVWDCESSKAPGSDGYNMNFIKQCWEEIGVEFTKDVTTFFETARLPADSNVTWVALAPKFVGAKEIKDLRPISMVRCIYKVISKVLTYKKNEERNAGLSWRIIECFCEG
ncbi:uncharacterized protein LOC107490214 [Arachis duranensis]|uniref:Uncharacterized protein LOC107490214 n=1 Tax=Arachis duranensis TaxID=130453 RepID=A0A6P4DDM8_ARADU|nr:uncharacterized protein LOC107490214 [Arachis duranensis]